MIEKKGKWRKARGEMLVKQNQDEEIMGAKTKPEVIEGVKSRDQEAVICRAKTQLKKGSVIPAKKRLVKTMMFDYIIYIVQSIACLLCSRGPSSSGAPKALSKNSCSCSEMVPPPNSSNGKKKNNIFPYTS